MTLGEKIYKLRRENNLTQEQLADLVKVTRQAISRWESDITLPEIDKVKELSKLFNCTIDYLLDDSPSSNNNVSNNDNNNRITLSISSFRHISFEYTSKLKIGKLPFVHIYFGTKKAAKGIIAIGFRSMGIISIGLLSLGLLSFGVLSLGLFSFAALSIGLFSLGAISIGLFSFGAIAIGILSMGSISIGQFSFGALAIGNYLALGDTSLGLVAIGATNAKGVEYQFVSGVKNQLTGFDLDIVKSILNEKVPSILKWVKEIALIILGA